MLAGVAMNAEDEGLTQALLRWASCVHNGAKTSNFTTEWPTTCVLILGLRRDILFTGVLEQLFEVCMFYFS